MIPKYAFFFWANSPLSYMRYLTLWSFRKMNPDWPMKLYTYDHTIFEKKWSTWEQQDFHSYIGEDYRDRLPELDIEIIPWEPEENMPPIGASHISNFVKWNILSREGGLYFDMDILFLQPIDPFYVNMQYSDVVICVDKGSLRIGILGSIAPNIFYSEVYARALQTYQQDWYQSAGVESIYKILGTQDLNLENFQILCDSYPQLSIVNISPILFYPIHYRHLEKLYTQEHIKDNFPNTIGLHWFAGNPVSQTMNNLFAEINKMTNTFANIVRELHVT